jgi:hypothetical protein
VCVQYGFAGEPLAILLLLFLFLDIRNSYYVSPNFRCMCTIYVIIIQECIFFGPTPAVMLLRHAGHTLEPSCAHCLSEYNVIYSSNTPDRSVGCDSAASELRPEIKIFPLVGSRITLGKYLCYYNWSIQVLRQQIF